MSVLLRRRSTRRRPPAGPTPLAAYTFDEASGAVLDVSGNGRSFALSGVLTRTGVGRTGNGLTTTSAGPVPVFSGAGVFGQATDRTVMCWIKGTGGVWHVRWNSSSISSGSWGLATLGNWQIRARNSSAVSTAGIAVPGDAATAWHHLAGTYKESTAELKFYLDGVLQQTTSLVGPLRTDADSLDLAEWGPGTTMDDLRIYGQALTAAQIAAVIA